MRIRNKFCSGLGLLFERIHTVLKQILKEPLYYEMNNEFTVKAVRLNTRVPKVLVQVGVDTSTDGRKLSTQISWL